MSSTPLKGKRKRTTEDDTDFATLTAENAALTDLLRIRREQQAQQQALRQQNELLRQQLEFGDLAPPDHSSQLPDPAHQLPMSPDPPPVMSYPPPFPPAQSALAGHSGLAPHSMAPHKPAQAGPMMSLGPGQLPAEVDFSLFSRTKSVYTLYNSV